MYPADSDGSGSSDSHGEEESSDHQSSDADQDDQEDDPLGGQTFDMSDEDAADVSAPESGDNDSEPELADDVGKLNGAHAGCWLTIAACKVDRCYV